MKFYFTPIIISKQTAKDISVVLKDIVYTEWQDLIVIYGIAIPSLIKNVSDEAAHNAMLESALTWQNLRDEGISKEWLHGNAVNNLKLDGYHVISSAPIDATDESCGFTKVITNEYVLHGSSCMLDPNLIAKFVQENCYIIPESVNTVILVTNATDFSLSELKSVHCGILSDFSHEPWEFLTNDIYYFNYYEKEITKARV